MDASDAPTLVLAMPAGAYYTLQFLLGRDTQTNPQRPTDLVRVGAQTGDDTNRLCHKPITRPGC